MAQRVGFDYDEGSLIRSIVDGTDTLADPPGGTGIAGKRFVKVKAGGNPGEYTYPAAKGGVSGVNEYDVPNGKPGHLLSGPGKVVEVEAGAAVAAGAELETTALGKAVTAATAGTDIVGEALTAAAADGDIIQVRLYPTLGVV